MKKMGRFSKEALERRRARRRREATKHMPTGDQAIQNALQKGLITMDQVSEFWKEEQKKDAEKREMIKALKKKPKAKIVYGLNTNSM
jgi:hypothetical protein